MRNKLATLALAGTLGLTGVAGAALVVPAVSYAATGDSTALTERVSTIKEVLAGLVTDGTLTQAQADRVATTLAEARPEGRGPGGGHHGGHGGGQVGLAAAAEALGLTEDEVQTALRSGQTLADLAEQEGVEQAALVDALVAAAQEHLAGAVADGRLTQAEADERAETLRERITASLDEVRGPGRGHGGHHGGPLGQGPAQESAPGEPGVSGSSTSV